MLFNMVFHVAASILYRSYCLGIVTAVLLFPPLFWYLTRDLPFDSRAGMLAMVIGAILHATDLATTTFFVQRRNNSDQLRP